MWNSGSAIYFVFVEGQSWSFQMTWRRVNDCENCHFWLTILENLKKNSFSISCWKARKCQSSLNESLQCAPDGERTAAGLAAVWRGFVQGLSTGMRQCHMLFTATMSKATLEYSWAAAQHTHTHKYWADSVLSYKAHAQSAQRFTHALMHDTQIYAST